MTKIYKALVEEFGYIAEAPDDDDSPEAKIRKQPAMSYAANKLSRSGQGAQPSQGVEPRQGDASSSFVSDKPAGDPSTMVPGEIRYAPGYDPNARTPDQPAPTDQKTDTNKPKPKPSMPVHPGVKAMQHFLNKNGFKIKTDGKFGPATKTAREQMWAKVQDSFPKGKYDGTPERRAQYDAYDKLSREYLDMGEAALSKNLNSPEFIKIMNQYGYDPKTGDPIGGVKSGSASGEVISGQAAQPSGKGVPPELSKVPNPQNGMEYWVNGSRYKYLGQFNPSTGQPMPGSGWTKNLDPSDKLQWNANRALSSTGYTGPDDDENAKKQFLASKKQNNTQIAQGTPVPGMPGAIYKENVELDIIRKLSGI